MNEKRSLSDETAPPGRKRTWIALSVLAIVAVLALLVWKPVQNRVTAGALWHGEGLDESAFRDLLEKSPNKVELLRRTWDIRRIPHRRAVITCLPELAKEDLAKLEPILVRGAVDADFAIREVAFTQLAKINSAKLSALARVQLNDVDPEVRILGVRSLHDENPKTGVPLVAPLLADSDPKIASLAAGALRRWTGEDFGVRVSQTFENPSGASESSSLEEFRKGMVKWKNWWAAHRAEYPAASSGVASAVFDGDAVQVDDFELSALDGSRARLSEFRGKTVLLNFWATWCTACVSEFDTLNKLQQRHSSDLVVLGISLDGVPDEHGHIGGHEEGEGGHDEASGKTEKVREQIARVAKARGLNYRIFTDPKNEIGARFNGGELPTNVLLDGNGRVLRRFVGPRSLEVLEQMLAGDRTSRQTALEQHAVK